MFNSIFTVETVKKSYSSFYNKIYLFIERERDRDRGGGERHFVTIILQVEATTTLRDRYY